MQCARASWREWRRACVLRTSAVGCAPCVCDVCVCSVTCETAVHLYNAVECSHNLLSVAIRHTGKNRRVSVCVTRRSFKSTHTCAHTGMCALCMRNLCAAGGVLRSRTFPLG